MLDDVEDRLKTWDVTDVLAESYLLNFTSYLINFLICRWLGGGVDVRLVGAYKKEEREPQFAVDSR